MSNKPLRLIGWLLATLVCVAAVWPSSAAAAALALKPPNDPDFIREWNLRRINAVEAWKTSQGAGITVAVVDTGVNYRHEDLAANVLKNKQYDAINKDFDALDLQGHGSGVAGVIAAVTNNKTGIAGVAPKAKIMAVRAFGAIGGADPANVSDGIMWAADHGAQVINLSLGNPVLPLSTVDPAIVYAVLKGALVVVAAGNETLPYCTSPGFNPMVICVGATDSLDRVASFSNYGLRLDMVAPGEGIYTTTSNFGATLLPNGYSSVNGTSFAAPAVAGVGALLMSMGASNLLAGLILRSSAKDLGLPGPDLTYGFGRLDAAAAVALCKQLC